MRPPLLAALLLVAAGLAGCASFELHESICSEGEEPTWAVTNTVGAICVRDGEPPREGFARYPRGRVPIWINPPEDHPHRTADGKDVYNVSPNDPEYPWWDEVVAEHPELGCDRAAAPLAAIDLQPTGKLAPRVTVLLNDVGNRCFRFDWPEGLGKVVRSDLTVEETNGGPVWERPGPDDAAARQFLRVASDTCMRVTASIQLARTNGTPQTYQLREAPVRRACKP